jgi:flagellar motor protein MotB
VAWDEKESEMTTARWWTLGTCALLALVVAGCQTDPDKLQMSEMADRIRQLTAENDDLRARLAAAQSELNNLRARNAQLEQQLRDAQAALAAKPPVEGPLDDEWRRSGVYTWTALGTDFLFDSGKATLRPQARPKLQEVVATIRDRYPQPEFDIWVLGHTDTDPIRQTKSLWADNLDLSVNRGMTVFKELQSLGLNPKYMIAGGQGEYNPVASNANRAGKQENRRVEIIAVPARGAPEGGGQAPTGEPNGRPMEPEADLGDTVIPK